MKTQPIPIRIHLSLNYLAVLLAGMGLAALLAWLAVERLYLDTQRENLLAQARLTAAAMRDQPISSEATGAYSQTLNAQPGLHTRVLGDQGAVLISLPLLSGNLPLEAPPAEGQGFVPAAELLQRPEIQQALKGQPASAVRSIALAGDRRVLYAAAPIFSGDNEITGIVYLATPLPPGGLPTDVIFELLGALLVAVLLAGAAGSLLARRIAHPLEVLVRASDAVARGDLQQQVPVETGINELNELGHTFNRMTEGLLRTEHAKNAFVADVTHELRTPLTVIKGTIETLEDGALDDLQGRGPLLASMQRETERLIRLVSDLLVLTRADAGALGLNLVALDLGELVRTRCENLALLASRHGVRLEVDEPENGPSAQCVVVGDADRLAQVLDNLLDNAIRYAPEESNVTVTIRQAGDEVECAVSDRGTGIPPEHLNMVFERFYRADASRQRQTGGSGLGLAIVRALVVAQGGRVRAESAPGTGTTITFWLPRQNTDT